VSTPAPFDRDFFAQRQLALDCAVAGVGSERRPVDLFTCPSVEPPAAELRVIRECHARATALGLTLPPYPKTTLQFVRAPEDTALSAQTRRRRDGVIEMAFVAGLPLDALRSVALHELRHVHQFAMDLRLPLAALEEDAEGFSWDAMQGWYV
jgi:hypothetical protein